MPSTSMNSMTRRRQALLLLCAIAALALLAPMAVQGQPTQVEKLSGRGGWLRIEADTGPEDCPTSWLLEVGDTMLSGGDTFSPEPSPAPTRSVRATGHANRFGFTDGCTTRVRAFDIGAASPGLLGLAQLNFASSARYVKASGNLTATCGGFPDRCVGPAVVAFDLQAACTTEPQQDKITIIDNIWDFDTWTVKGTSRRTFTGLTCGSGFGASSVRFSLDNEVLDLETAREVVIQWGYSSDTTIERYPNGTAGRHRHHHRRLLRGA